jgi:tetratricopeptide (TPR) repeat protein
MIICQPVLMDGKFFELVFVQDNLSLNDKIIKLDQMKKLIFLTFIFTGCAVLSPLQKGRLISLFHLIETAKYSEAKEVAEEMIEGGESSQWPNTWYARGLLCQSAYMEGKKKNDAKLFELYPDQLYVAFDSYEKARDLDDKGRFDRQLAPKYVQLANEFQKIGVVMFEDNNFSESLRSFEQALLIKQSPILNVETDTLLIYNTALAAFESETHDKARQYLNKLHNFRYSVNATHLYFETVLNSDDSLSAEKILREGVRFYNYDETMVLLLSDYLFESGDSDGALEILAEALTKQPLNAQIHYTKGLIYQKTEFYDRAIEAYNEVVRIDPEYLMAYVNIATCYYNRGVEMDETARSLTSNAAVMEEQARSEEAFQEAVKWLDKANQQEPDDQDIITRIYDLYTLLRENEKARLMEDRIN